MARSNSTRFSAPLHGWPVVVLCAVLLSPAIATADLNGHWRYDFGFVGITDVTQAGSSVSFVLTNSAAETASFSGTVTGTSLNATAPAPTPFDCGLVISATIAPDESSFAGFIATDTLCPNPASAPISFQRCGCFDGNSADGDGCDALCRVESCYSCSPEPSVCAPQADGTPCDDLAACTSGETCTSAVCGGGSPVTPCVDLSGAWSLHFSYPDFAIEQDNQVVFTQINTQLSTGVLSGTIDPATGVFQLNEVVTQFCPADHFAGQAALDGLTLTGLYTDYIMTPTQCPAFSANVTGTRCGGGTLDSGEECDDGNKVVGDGCDNDCSVEQCYTCTTDSPSVCSPLADGTVCDDGDLCSVGDSCQAGVCSSGSAMTCAPCLSCVDGACVAAPRSGCLVSTAPTRSTLFLRNTSPDENDVITWKWRRGEETTLAALGDPTQSTAYRLCIYDESASEPALLFGGVAQQTSCPDLGCWTGDAHGFSYRSTTGATDGLTRIDLRAQTEGRARVVVKGKGPFLTHQYGLPTPPLSLPLRVQLHAVDSISPNPTCFESEFDAAGATRNATGVFKAHATGP